MQRFKIIRRLIFAAVVLAACLLSNFPQQVSAQSGWQTPQWIPGLVDTTGPYPVFVTDLAGSVHIFHSQWVHGHYAIVYSNWMVGVGWTTPVDIIVPDVGQARIAGAFLDDTGKMNIIFWGGDAESADIYFTQAALQDVMHSSAWSSPLLIGPNAIAPTTVAAVSDQKGYIAVVYSGNDEGNGLYSIFSKDHGATWSIASAFFFAMNDLFYPSALQMTLAKDGSAHAVWSLGDETGNSHSIFYAKSAYQTGQWTSPVTLAEETEYVVDTPSMIEYDDSLMVIYHSNFPLTRYMIRSFDGGNTWTSPIRLFEQVGSNGAAALVIDSSNTLHMFFGNRIDRQSAHGLWHSVWQEESWSVPEAIVYGPQVLIGVNNEEGFDPSFAQAVIVQGNLLLVVWRHDPLAGPQHVWYTYKLLNTPAIPTRTMQVPTASPTSVAESTPLPTALLSTPERYADDASAVGSPNVRNTLLISILPALVLIVLIVFLQRKYRERQ